MRLYNDDNEVEKYANKRTRLSGHKALHYLRTP